VLGLCLTVPPYVAIPKDETVAAKSPISLIDRSKRPKADFANQVECATDSPGRKNIAPLIRDEHERYALLVLNEMKAGSIYAPVPASNFQLHLPNP
jgi:hypothetical protein